MKAIKEQFLSLLKNFDVYQNTSESDSKMTQGGRSLLCNGLSTRSRTRGMAQSRLRPIHVDENSNKLSSAFEDLPLKPYTPRFSKSQHKDCTCKTKKHHCSKYKMSKSAAENKENLVARQKRHMMNVRKAKNSGDYMVLKEAARGKNVQNPEPVKSRGDQTSVWDSVDNKTACLSSDNYSISPKKSSENILAGLSPMKYSNPEEKNQVYSGAIKDISVITDVSQVSLREQPSAIGLDLQSQGPLHSTVCYPLHSTMNKTQINHFGFNNSMEEFSDIEPQGSSDNASETASKISKDRKKTVKLSKMRQLKVPSRIRNPVHVVPSHECVGPLSTHSPPNMRPDDTFTLEEDVVTPPKRTIYPISEDTICDSSYLTDYEDGKMYNHFAQSSGSTCDQHHGSMKMMKRQTARIDLEQTKTMESTHLSMVGYRGSMTDLSVIPPHEDNNVRVSKKRSRDSVDSSLRPKSIGAECVRVDSSSHCNKIVPPNSLQSCHPVSNVHNQFDLVKLPKREDPQGMAIPFTKSSSSQFQKPSKQARYSTGYESCYSVNNSTGSSLQSCNVIITKGRNRSTQSTAVRSFNLNECHKRKLARRMKKFNKDLQRSESLGNLSNIKTLGHF